MLRPRASGCTYVALNAEGNSGLSRANWLLVSRRDALKSTVNRPPAQGVRPIIPAPPSISVRSSRPSVAPPIADVLALTFRWYPKFGTTRGSYTPSKASTFWRAMSVSSRAIDTSLFCSRVILIASARVSDSGASATPMRGAKGCCTTGVG